MSFRRSRRSPTSRRTGTNVDAARMVDYATAISLGWPARKIFAAGDTIAWIGSLATLAQVYPADEESPTVQAKMGFYNAVAARINHNRTAVGDGAAALNTLALMLGSTVDSPDEFDDLWLSIGRSALRNVQLWPDNLAVGCYRVIRGLVDQVTIAQMPGYLFGQPADFRSPPPAGPLMPRGPVGGLPGAPGSGTTHAPRQTQGTVDSIKQWALDFAASYGADIGTAVGGAAGSELPVLGNLATGYAGEYLGEQLEEWARDHGGRKDPSKPEVSSMIEIAASRAVARARRNRNRPQGVEDLGGPPVQGTPQQPSLPGVRPFPEPGQTAPGGTPGRTQGQLPTTGLGGALAQGAIGAGNAAGDQSGGQLAAGILGSFGQVVDQVAGIAGPVAGAAAGGQRQGLFGAPRDAGDDDDET